MYAEKNFIWVTATEAPRSGAEGDPAGGLGAAGPQRGVRRSPGGGLGGRSPPEKFEK